MFFKLTAILMFISDCWLGSFEFKVLLHLPGYQRLVLKSIVWLACLLISAVILMEVGQGGGFKRVNSIWFYVRILQFIKCA